MLYIKILMVLVLILGILSLSAQIFDNNSKIQGKYQVLEATSKIARNNTIYLSLTLWNKSVKFKALRFFNGNQTLDRLKKIYRIGNILLIEGKYDENYNVVKIFCEKHLNPNEYHLGNFISLSNIKIEELIPFLNHTINNLRDPFLKLLLNKLFMDDDLRRRFLKCPASVGSHHSYLFGLFKHVVSMIKSYNTLEQNYPSNSWLNRDLIITGIIIHDIGKTEVYSINNGIPVKNSKKALIGHFAIGVQIIKKHIDQIYNFPTDLKNKLLHMILSHHGRKKWGSQVEPQFPEAEILHLLDLLDFRYNNNSNNSL